MAAKNRFPLYISQETTANLDIHYTFDGSKSKSNFIENAINFYIGYLTAEADGTYLPKALSASIDGRLGTFEDRVSKLLFKQSVELDMLMNILAEASELDEENVRQLRGESVINVKRTNGQLSLADTFRRRNT